MFEPWPHALEKAESHNCWYRWGGRMEIGNNTKRDQRDHPRANAGAEELDSAHLLPP